MSFDSLPCSRRSSLAEAPSSNTKDPDVAVRITVFGRLYKLVFVLRCNMEQQQTSSFRMGLTHMPDTFGTPSATNRATASPPFLAYLFRGTMPTYDAPRPQAGL